ncbi:sugar transferase [Patescibacteria group bacterium]|nr:sugar transferase [Patescibacteria group bacterium]MBU0777222.1 sugar transferase [Patescibacteria group bacterium]MBU0845917.1 sugar transferase [Patescibacteria group bacterium]MBU0922944.1 sugar transferase [Patescibacteria group bacterium]MBU1066221.1 sugar transferase [Patescibacteria group bacterium]
MKDKLTQMNYWLQRLLALVLYILALPFFSLLWLLIKFEDGGPLFFKQERMGKGKKPFIMHKIRTMVVGAEKLKEKYLHLNEADGPVFKIRNDPRYTKIGKILTRTGLDELPQLVNVVRGEMALVGPRPLPWDEAIKVPKRYQKRFSVLPGITSSWVVKGSHKLGFDEWMNLDLEYVKKRSNFFDVQILFLTGWLITKWSVCRLSKCTTLKNT